MNKVNGEAILKKKKELTIKFCPKGNIYMLTATEKNVGSDSWNENKINSLKDLLLLESFFFLQENQKTLLYSYFQIPLLTLPHPRRHIVYSSTHYLGAMKTGSRESNICKLLVTSTTPTTIVLFP